MKKLKRPLAAALALVLALSVSACGKTGGWIMKTNEVEVPVGVYITNLYSAYLNAASQVEDTSKSPLGQKVEETDAAEWIVNKAKDMTKRYIVVMNLCKEMNVTLTDEEVKSVQSSVNNDWDQNNASYQKFGISKDSVYKTAEFSKYSQKLFLAIYGKDGTKAVSDSDLRSFFTKNYVSFKYIAVSLKDSDNKDLSQEDKDKIKADLQKRQEAFEGGKTFKEVVDEYNEDHASAKLTMQEKVVNLDEAGYTEDFTKAVKELDAGKGTVITVNGYMYLVGKYDIEKEDEYLEENRNSVLSDYKGDEYTETVDSAVKELNCEINDGAVKKYSPQWVENTGK